MTTLYPTAAVAVAAIVTAAIRFAPFLLFDHAENKDDIPSWLSYLGHILPPALVAVIVVYCFRNVELASVSSLVPQAIGAVAAAGLHLWKRNELISIFGATALYMILVQYMG